ncbi:hypothetical protein BC834DRAFT_847687 [Gloeopeniophorella convolvens]|nr:hypothetical protein BC834DRAFT_847687 [Gloeopeniophorella convolvens]
MSTLSPWDFLDLYAQRDDREEDDLDDEEEEDFDNFLDEVGGSDAGETTDNDRSLTPERRLVPLPRRHEVATSEADDLEREARRFVAALITGQPAQDSEVLAYVPLEMDPGIWCFAVKLGFERDLVFQIARRCLTPTERTPPRINHAFSRDSIPGYIFIEAPTLPDAFRAVDGLVTVRHNAAPRLIDLEWRLPLLQRRSPTASNPVEGQWVRALCGLYRGDVGFVCRGVQDSSEEHALVAFVPRLRPRNEMKQHRSGPSKRKRQGRPAPRLWTEMEVIQEWGMERLISYGRGRFRFNDVDYECGLVLWRIPVSHIVREDHAPTNLDLFAQSSDMRGHDTFRPWLTFSVQDGIESGARVIGVAGPLRGVVGRVFQATTSTVSLVAAHTTGSSHRYDLVPKRELLPYFVPGDNVKDRWSSSAGIVIKTDHESHALVYLHNEDRSEAGFSHVIARITARVFEVESHRPVLHEYRISEGTWVEWGTLVTRRGVVVQSQLESKLRVKEEGTKDTWEFDADEVRVAPFQGESALRLAPVQREPVQVPDANWQGRDGKDILVTHGPRKGQIGTVHNSNEEGAIVRFHSDFATNSAQGHFVKWDWVSMRHPSERWLSRTRPSSPTRRTATPEPDPGPSQSRATPPPEPRPSWEVLWPAYERADVTISQQLARISADVRRGVGVGPPGPEVSASHSRTAEDHWIHEDKVREVMIHKRLALAVRDPNGTSGPIGQSAKTVALSKRTIDPGPGEVVVAVDPRTLVPWLPGVGDSVIVVVPPWLGWVDMAWTKGNSVFPDVPAIPAADSHATAKAPVFWTWDYDSFLITHGSECTACSSYLGHLNDGDPSWIPSCGAREHWISTLEQRGWDRATSETARDLAQRNHEIAEARDFTRTVVADAEKKLADAVAARDQAVQDRVETRSWAQHLQDRVHELEAKLQASESKSRTQTSEVDQLRDRIVALDAELSDLRSAQSQSQSGDVHARKRPHDNSDRRTHGAGGSTIQRSGHGKAPNWSGYQLRTVFDAQNLVANAAVNPEALAKSRALFRSLNGRQNLLPAQAAFLAAREEAVMAAREAYDSRTPEKEKRAEVLPKTLVKHTSAPPSIRSGIEDWQEYLCHNVSQTPKGMIPEISARRGAILDREALRAHLDILQCGVDPVHVAAHRSLRPAFENILWGLFSISGYYERILGARNVSVDTHDEGIRLQFFPSDARNATVDDVAAHFAHMGFQPRSERLLAIEQYAI